MAAYRTSAYGGMDDENAEEEENEEEDEESEDGGGKGRMLGFMFGNVDDAGDLDEEYFDQDAKEHLSALADQLGPSLVDLELSTKRKGLGSRLQSEEQEDYAKKAENAVDYEDIQEEYEGDEVQVPVQDQQFYAQAALAVPFRKAGSFVPEEDNYDEEDEIDEEGKDEPKVPIENVPSPPTAVSKPAAEEDAAPEVSKSVDSSEVVKETNAEAQPAQEEPSSTKLHQQDAIKIELPVLCEEDGKEVLRFSELFGVREPYWVLGGRAGRPKRHPFREKFGKAEDENEALEEDEEEVFKSCGYRHLPENGLSNLEVDEDESNEIEEEEEGDSAVDEVLSDSFHVVPRESRIKGQKVEFCPAQEMKSVLDGCDEIVQWREGIPNANFVALHQQEWEDNIVWEVLEGQERSKSREMQCEEVFSEISFEVDSDSEEDIVSTRDRQNSTRHPPDTHADAVAELQSGTSQQYSRTVVIEPLSRPSLDSGRVTEDSIRPRHPQMLRLESVASPPVSNDHGGNGELGAFELGDRLSKLSVTCSQRNNEIASGSWLDSIVWDSGSPPDGKEYERPKVIYDLQDHNMVFEISNNKRGQQLRVHAAAVVLSSSGTKDTGADGTEVAVPPTSSIARFNISNDKYYTNKKAQHHQKSHAKKRAVHGVKVMHSLPAIKLQTMKPKLTNKDLSNFHRPKAVWYPHHNEVAAKEQGKLAVKGPMKVILKTLGGKGSKLYVDASETVEVLKVKAAKKLGDLKASEKSKVLYSGKELQEGSTFAEQQVPPNSVLHLVRTRVYPWPKAQRLPGENKPIRPPGAFKKKSELSVKDGHVALMEYCEERPLLLSNVGMGARLSTYYRKLTPTDSTAVTLRNERGSWVGIPLPLEPTEDSPFLGDIRPGDTVSSLETNVYRSPAFGHKVAYTDFLLVRSAKGKLSLRRIDSLHVVGQQEPHLEVLTPTSKTVQNYIGARLLVYVYREFRNNEKPTSTPRVRGDELIAQFPSLTEGFIRKRLKHCADLQKGSGGEMWWVMRNNFRIPSEEELRRMVTPEMVCTYESMQAGLHHLKRMGVQKLTQSSGLSSAMNMLPDEAITLAAASHIERELQITPWNLSSNFVSATLQGRGSLERLEITGAGDPSGRGLGFSYLRVATKPPNVGAIVEKKAAVARGGGAVTGTDADLRRLSMDAAKEVLLKFKVSEAQIEKLTRWHRIALVRKLSSEQAASLGKVGVAALNKFARGQRMSFLQLQQQTREKCQEIWDRQVQSLAAAEGDDSESDGEANGDLDSFAGDLENLLEAEEGEDGDERKGRREGMRGLGARRRALQAQKEEEMEDEEAEAAELRRMLLEDDEAEEEQKKKKSGNASKEKKVVQGKEQNGNVAVGSTSTAKKTKKRVLKRIIRTKKADGSFTSREIIITDPKEVAAYLAKKSSVKVPGLKTPGEKKDTPKKGTVKPKKEKKIPVPKEVTKPKTSLKKVPKEGSGKEKPSRDGLRVVCGACGQLGHMRTNKKCPLYKEDPEGNLQRHDSAAAEGLLERQGTKITIKKKKIEELQLNKPSDSPKLPANDPVNTVPKPAKIPSLKIKMQPMADVNDASLGGSGSRREKNSSTPGPKAGVKVKPLLVGSDAKFAEGITSPRGMKGSKSKVPKKQKKKKLKENLPSKQQVRKKMGDSVDHPTGGQSSDRDREVQIQAERERKREEKQRAREEKERRIKEKEREDMERERDRMEREQEEGERLKQIRDQKKRERELERQRDKDQQERQLKEKAAKDREEQDRIEAQRLKELREKKKQRIREEKERAERKRVEEERRLREERLRQERLEREEEERLEKEKLEHEREQARLERERLGRLEMERLETERLENERREREKEKRLQKAKQKALREEALRKERLRQEQEEKEKEEQERRAQQKREEKMREKKRQGEKLKVQEKMQPLVHGKEFRGGRDVIRQPNADIKEKVRGLKKRVHSDLATGPQRPADPPKRQRTRGGGEVDLANMFESIVNNLVSSDVAYLFVKPVSKKDAPDYQNFVKKPMDLGTIREKARKMVYKCRDDFRMDVEQIVVNAHDYNDGRNPGIPPLAELLLQLCDNELRARKAELEDAEDAIERFEDDEPYTPGGRGSPPLDRRRRQRAL
ncbi:unnamed protein product [Calypogeia fissa]